MFSLIITIISIALVAALAVATIYYGGSAFTQGTAKANSAALVSAAQQIAGANSLYQNDHSGTRADLTALTTASNGYMSSAPSLPGGITLTAVDTTTGVITGSIPAAAEAVCKQINAAAGGTLALAADVAAIASQPFGCYGTTGSVTTFSFKG